MNPFQAVRDLERALCEYTGAPFAVAVNSCTMALLLAVAWCKTAGKCKQAPANPWGKPLIEIPRRTYVGVPMSIIHAGGWPAFRDEEWVGSYQLRPLPIYDCARKFTGGMWLQCATPQMYCVSFHAAKLLGDTQGGAILHDDYQADQWLRRARFDGRTEGVPPAMDTFPHLGWHCYMSPDVAARLLWKLSILPKHNAPLPNDGYPDLSTLEIFR